MTLAEINDMIFEGRVSETSIERMDNLRLLPRLKTASPCDPAVITKRVDVWRSTFIGSYIYHYPKYYGLVLKLSRLFEHRPEWKDFTKKNIDRIVETLNREVAKSTARYYCATIKSVLNDAKDEVDLPYPKFAERLSLKATPSVGVYLSLEDLKKLESYRPENEKEQIVLAQFLCGCYTGARHSDILQMTVDNINGNFLTYVSQKTKIQTTVEAKPILRELLPIACKRAYVDSVFNEAIRNMCRKAGICEQMKVYRRGENEVGQKWEFVASHTARRSFATNLALLKVDIIQIAKRMGHTDVKTTYKYICCPITKLNDQANAFFE